MAIIITKIIAKPYAQAAHTTNPTLMWQYGHIVELAIYFFQYNKHPNNRCFYRIHGKWSVN